MTEGVSPNRIARFSEAAQLIAFVVGGLYALGLVIVSVDLGRYGIVHLDLARPEYIVSGALWVTVVLAPVVTSVLGLLSAWDSIKVRSFKGFSLAVIGISLSGFVWPVAMMLYLSSPIEHGWLLTMGLRHLLVLAVSTTAAVFCFLPTLIFARLTFGQGGHWRSNAVSLFAVVAALVVSVAYATWVYTAFAFPELDRAFGGGRKPVVQIALRQEAPPSWEVTGMPISADGTIVGPVLMVLERSDAIVVVSAISMTDQPWFGPRRHGSPTAIARELIAVVHYPRQMKPATHGK